MKNALLVGLGAMIGAMARYGLLIAIQKPPWIIALINISGSFLLGITQLQNKEYLSAIGNVSLQTIGSIALCAVGFAIGSKLSS